MGGKISHTQTTTRLDVSTRVKRGFPVWIAPAIFLLLSLAVIPYAGVQNDEALFAEYTGMLALMNRNFSESWVKEWHVFRTPYAQPVFTTNFVDLIPAHRTPIGGLYVTDSTQFYPEDRTISAAIEQGRKVAAMIMAEPVAA